MYVVLFLRSADITDMDILDCIVIGAGIQGSATTYHLAKRGLSVLMMDQVSCIVHSVIVPLRSLRNKGSFLPLGDTNQNCHT